MNKFLFWLCIALFLTSTVRAQPFIDLVSIQAADMPVSPLYKGSESTAISNNLWGAQLNLPFVLDKRNVLLFNPGYRHRTYFQETDTSSFYTLFFPLVWSHTLHDTTNKIVLVGVYRFNSTSELKPGTINDVYSGAVIFNKTMNKKFTWKLGVYYSREFFGNYFLPLVGCDWHPTEKIFVFGLIPQNAVFDYTFTPSFHGGISYLGFEESYKQEGVDSYARLSEGLLKFFVDWYIPKTKLVLTLDLGNTVDRQYTLHSDENNTPITNKLNPAESLVYRATLAYRFVTNSEFKTRRAPAP